MAGWVEGGIAVLLLGAGATAVMDLCGLAARRVLGTPLPDYGMVGRWLGHLAHGRLRHASIAAAPAVRGERAIGLAFHYAVGVAFAAVLLAFWGTAWLDQPSPGPALAVGLVSVLAPFLVMQPAMGAGIAARRAPRPWLARGRSLVNHFYFALGLYAAGWTASGLLA